MSEKSLTELDRELLQLEVGDDDDDANPHHEGKVVNFSEEVEKAIESILPDDDPFSKTDFDVTDYVNHLFPTEQSLGNIDDVMNRMKGEIQEIDTEIADIVQTQSATSIDGQQAVVEAKAAIQELFTRIREIKAKTDMSESMVKEITRDIKQLDQAKKNLTASITTLNHLHFLLSGVESLQSLTKTKQYGQIADLLPGIMNVLEHFDRYLGIAQIKELSDQVQQVRKELKTQIVVDFKDNLSSASAQRSNANIMDVCRVVSVVDENVKNELSVWFLQQQLGEYLVLFDDTQDNAWLDKLDERYTWFRNKLLEFEEKYLSIFPSDWHMPRKLAVEFCTVTRNMLEKLCVKRVHEIDVKLLMFAIQRTMNFESMLCKRFPTAPDAKNPFQGVISQMFDVHLNIFIVAQDRNLNSLLDQITAKFREGGAPKVQLESTAVTLSSSGDLFMVYKKCIQQLTQIASTDKSLVDLSHVFKKYLREYASRCMSIFLPRISAAQITSTAGLIQSLLKEGEVPRLTNDEVYLTCCILTTAEFCAETTQQLQEKLKEKVRDPSLHQKLDMSPEQDVFHNVITSCIQVLVQNLEGSVEPSLSAMTKMQWSSVENVGDESRYVANIKSHIRANVPKVRDYLSNARKYFIQFCLKFASSFIVKFLNCLFRCKPLSLTGAEQLLLDTHSLKTELMNLPNVDSLAARKPPAAYTKVVLKGMTKAEMILKLVMTPLDSVDVFVEQYLKLLPDSDVLEVQKILEMKSVRRLDQTQVIDLFRSKIESVSSAVGALLNATSTVGGSSTSTSMIDAESTIKKLEKLVKKRL